MEVELERAQARARRPGPNFGPVVKKHKAHKSPGLMPRKASGLFSKPDLARLPLN